MTVEQQEMVSRMRRDVRCKKIIHSKMLNRTDVAKLQMLLHYSYDKHCRVYSRNYYLINKCVCVWGGWDGTDICSTYKICTV